MKEKSFGLLKHTPVLLRGCWLIAGESDEENVDEYFGDDFVKDEHH